MSLLICRCKEKESYQEEKTSSQQSNLSHPIGRIALKHTFLTMTRFRPCIDLHAGQVKQIVGGTLDSASEALQTNHVSQLPAEHFARLYRDNGLEGAHVIMLGGGNDEAARRALRAWPGRLQVGGGIRDENAKEWIEAGAEKVGFIFSFNEREGEEERGRDKGRRCVSFFVWIGAGFFFSFLRGGWLT